MTLEDKVKEWLDEYDQKMKSLKASYDFGFEWLPVNEAGETDAQALLDLNDWYADHEGKIKKEMVEKAKILFGKDEAHE